MRRSYKRLPAILTVALSPEEAIQVASQLLDDARAGTEPALQRMFYYSVDVAFSKVDNVVCEVLHTSSNARDQELRKAIDALLAERDALLSRLDKLGLTRATSHDADNGILRLKGFQIDDKDQRVYVPLLAKLNPHAPGESFFPLMERQGLSQEQPSSHAAAGDSGAGKTTFNRQLERELWSTYSTGEAIPLFIDLSIIDEPQNDLVAKQLRRRDFTEGQIQELKLTRQFILICDDYDESQQTANLYDSNRLGQPGQWNARMIVSCHSEYLDQSYRDQFQPKPVDQPGAAASRFQEACISPFSRGQIRDYVEQYLATSEHKWTTEEFMDKLANIPNLLDLSKNPFLLTLALEALPRVVGSEKDLARVQISRVLLYDKFIEQWLEVGKRRLQDILLSPEERAEFLLLLDDDSYMRSTIGYLRNLATALFEEQSESVDLQYPVGGNGATQESLFSNPNQESSPLIRSVNQYQFMHRSWLEYFYSLTVYDPAEVETVSDGNLPSFVNHPLALQSLVP
ncbi:hypothetical protein BGX33_000702 [Mortierella sp. NVP41]|nr:hypothetical protein BGX33_000702 [Mortierella sp. NVP41]